MFVTMISFALRWLGLCCVLSSLAACAPIAAVIGYGGSAVQIAAQFDRIKLLGDGFSYLESGKSITDHAVSKIVGAACRLLNVVRPDHPVCKSQNASTQQAMNARVTLAAAGDDWYGSDAPAIALSRHAANSRVSLRALPVWDDADADH